MVQSRLTSCDVAPVPGSTSKMKILFLSDVQEVDEQLSAAVGQLKSAGAHVTFLIRRRGELSRWLSNHYVYYFIWGLHSVNINNLSWTDFKLMQCRVSELVRFFYDCKFHAVINYHPTSLFVPACVAARLPGVQLLTVFDSSEVPVKDLLCESKSHPPRQNVSWWLKSLVPLIALGQVLRICDIARQLYLVVKRLADAAGAAVLGVCLLPVISLVVLMRLLRRQRVFEVVEIVGRFNKPVRLSTFLPAANLDSGCCQLGGLVKMIWWLPSLWNIFCGQISFIGPRLLKPQELTAVGNEKLFYQLCPGVMGWSQMKYGSGLTSAEAIRMDQSYMLSVNPILDLKILAGIFVGMLKQT